MVLHIIFIFAFILFISISILFGIYKKNESYTVLIFIFAVFSFLGTILSGKSAHDNYNYRTLHSPTINDVNNGYAKITISYTTTVGDSISVDTTYGAVWIGTNQKYEHYINDIEETYYWKNHKK